jgi:hypothetical protein
VKKSNLFFLLLLSILSASFIVLAQDNARVRLEKPETAHPGGPIAFNITLNEPLPKGAYFQLRISPTVVDQQIILTSGEPLDVTRKTFRVAGGLPESAVPGKWHIAVIYLFLQGTSWTNNTIKANNFTFDVEGKPFPIPTEADISLAK